MTSKQVALVSISVIHQIILVLFSIRYKIELHTVGWDHVTRSSQWVWAEVTGIFSEPEPFIIKAGTSRTATMFPWHVSSQYSRSSCSICWSLHHYPELVPWQLPGNVHCEWEINLGVGSQRDAKGYFFTAVNSLDGIALWQKESVFSWELEDGQEGKSLRARL